MRKIILIIGALLITCIALAQPRLTLIVAAQPPAQLSEWTTKREILTLIVNTQGAVAGQFKIKTEIRTPDGTVAGTTDLARSPLFTPNSSGTTIFVANDVIPLEYMIFTGKYRSTLQRTGKLPADNYTICVQLVRPIDFIPVGEQQCRTFYLASTQLPILMKPYNEEVLDAKAARTAITFRWTPVTPRQPAPVTYRIQVFEVLPTQSPVQALRSNQPLLDKEILAATQYIWQPQLSFLPYDEETKKPPTFIWTIQSLDVNHNPVTQTDGSGEGRSEPIIFFVNPDKNRK